MLRRCHESVLSQNVDARITHVVVADGHARIELDGWKIEHVRLPRAHGDCGNTPRAIGAMLAAAEDADFIAWLDADNWYYPDHLGTMLEALRQTKAIVACCRRDYYTPDGERLPIDEVDERERKHVDTSCMLIHRLAFGLTDIWLSMPRVLSPICDRVFFTGVQRRNCLCCFTGRKTVAYTTTYAPHYICVGREPPANSKSGNYENEYAYLASAEGVRETVSRMGFWPG